MIIFNKNFLTICMIIMFVYSGISKIITLGNSEGSRFAKKINILPNYGNIIVLLAGIFEIVCCIIIIYGILSNKNKYIKTGIYGLVIFTILATLIFYTFPFKNIQFLSNFTIMCGLLMVPLLF